MSDWKSAYKTYFSNILTSETNFHTEKTDDLIKYCEVCEQTYEHSYINSIRSYRTFYYGKHIPSIGKEHKNCPRCTAERASELVKYQGV